MILTPNERRALENASRERWLHGECVMCFWLLIMAALGVVGALLFVSGQ